MIIHYFNTKKNKDKNKAQIIYNRILLLSKNYTNSKFILNKDFQNSFEILSIILILFLKNIKDLKQNNYNFINQEIMNLYVKDLDYSFREIGIGDMSIGKYVKKHIKKFYFRVSKFEKIINENDIENCYIFIKNLNFIHESLQKEFANEIFDIYKKIRIDVQKM